MASATPAQFRLPTARAFEGMKRILFQPFDFAKWLALGFTAWLAGLLDGGGGGGGSSTNTGNRMNFDEAGPWITANLTFVIVVALLVLAVIATVLITLLWVSSRGKFMLLDNVVHNRAAVKVPWKEFRTQGNSLFRWKLIFSTAVLGIALLVTGAGWLAFARAAPDIWIVLAAGVIVYLPIGLVTAYTLVLLEDFVIPLMYDRSLTTNEAWACFFVIHRRNAGRFVLYVLWKGLLWFLAAVAILVLGCATLCIGLLLIALPYVGAVILLPFSVFFRLLGPEFLRQFGSEFDILSRHTPPPLDPA